MLCPKCNINFLGKPGSNALSRFEDIEICSSCGSKEAMEEFEKAMGTITFACDIQKDENGKEVKEGDILVEDTFETALLFVVENGKPVLKARWSTGILDKYDLPHIEKSEIKLRENIKNGIAPQSLKGFFEMMAGNIRSKEVQDLKLVEGPNLPIIKKFLEEDNKFIDFGSDADDKIPIAEFPDGTKLIGVYDFYE